MYCTKCGTFNDNANKFCVNCGELLLTLDNPIKENKQEKFFALFRKRSAVWWFLIGWWLLLYFVIFVAWWYYPFHSWNEYYKKQNAKNKRIRIAQANIDLMDGHEFEYFCGNLLVQMGYYNVEVTKGSGDQGVDVIAYKDGCKYAFQCKRFSGNVGNRAVQEVIAGKKFYNCDYGVVITNRYFTNSAIELASKTGIILFDRDDVFKIIKEISLIEENTL